MKIALYRIDDRLIHGQVMVHWTGKVGADTIVIVDDPSAKDSFMQQVFQLAAPAHVKVLVTTCAGFKSLTEKETGNAIALFKDPISAAAAVLNGIAPSEMVIGNLASMPGRTKATSYAYLSLAEIEKLTALQQSGWKVYFQKLPDESRQDFKKS